MKMYLWSVNCISHCRVTRAETNTVTVHVFNSFGEHSRNVLPPSREYDSSCGIGNIKSFDNGEKNIDEVLTRQCPYLGLSIHGAYVDAWRIRRLQTETGGAHKFIQVRPLGG
jgi:hypothetical protein